MNASQIYILISIIVLAIIAVFVFLVNKNKQKKLTPLAGLASALVIAGILFGESRLVGYSLMGAGVILAVVDIVKKRRKDYEQ